MDKQRDRQIERQTNREIDKQRDRQIERQTNREKDKLSKDESIVQQNKVYVYITETKEKIVEINKK